MWNAKSRFGAHAYGSLRERKPRCHIGSVPLLSSAAGRYGNCGRNGKPWRTCLSALSKARNPPRPPRPNKLLGLFLGVFAPSREVLVCQGPRAKAQRRQEIRQGGGIVQSSVESYACCLLLV